MDDSIHKIQDLLCKVMNVSSIASNAARLLTSYLASTRSSKEGRHIICSKCDHFALLLVYDGVATFERTQVWESTMDVVLPECTFEFGKSDGISGKLLIVCPIVKLTL